MDYPEQFSCHEGVLGAVVSCVEVFHWNFEKKYKKKYKNNYLFAIQQQDLPGEEFTAHVNFVCHRLEEMQLTGDLDQFNDVIKQQMPSFVQNATVEEEREAKLGSFCVFCVLFGRVCCDFNAMCWWL